jgi:signal transduction histidine kinase
MSRIRADADRGRRFSCFETHLGGQAYQIVATLRYHDQFREQLDNVFGFTVNLDWVRQHYFPELTSQVAHIGSAGTGLDLSVLDDGWTSVTHRNDGAQVRPADRRPFELLFIDPRVVALDPPPDLPRRVWFAQVTVAEDPTLAAAMRGANWTLGVAALAAVALAVGFALTGRAVRAAAALAEMRSEFVSTVTHELKTPIATIRAAGDTLASGRIVSASTSREYAEIVVQEAKRLTRLVENLLAYGRITDVAEAYAVEPIALRDVAARALDAFRSQLAAGNFHVELDIPEGLAPVSADRTAIELLFDNLLDNAIRYSDHRRFVRIGAAARDGFVDIQVADHGVGIPADEIDRVLRKFVRGRFARSGGSGLGLAIVSRIVRDHGGTIAIASALGEGTTVTASIPKASESDEKANSRG